MISFPASSKIYVVHNPVSFACGIDGMCRICLKVLELNPIGSAYFLFVNKRRTQVRVLWYDSQGFSLCTKRLSKGILKNWPRKNCSSSSIVNYFDAINIWTGGKINQKNTAHIWKKVS